MSCVDENMKSRLKTKCVDRICQTPAKLDQKWPSDIIIYQSINFFSEVVAFHFGSNSAWDSSLFNANNILHTYRHCI